ncbi:MAG: META domain-containing protein [Gemmatimonadota bacterium]
MNGMAKCSVAFATILFLSACTAESDSTDTETTDDPLTGIEWRWVEFQGMDDTNLTISNPENYLLTLLADGSVQLKADCNQAAGSYTRDGSQLTIELGPMTMAACPPESNADKYVADLGYVRSFVMEDGELFLALMMDGGIMRFSPAQD